MAGLLLKLRTWWETADRTQKSVTVIGGAFLALLLFATFYFASRPKMTIAFGGLSPTDVGTVSGEIQKLGVPVEFDLAGNVMVPNDKVAEVRAKLAAAGKMPAGTHFGNEELANFNLMLAPSVEQEKLKAIMEGELSRSIEQVTGVAAARVHLTRGERSAFTREEKPASASIFITEKSGGTFGAEGAQGVAKMVASAVSGLDPSRVFVLDNAGRTLYDGSELNGSLGNANTKLEAEKNETQRRERDLQAKLDTVIGRGNAIVTVNLEMDFDKVSEESNNPKPVKNPPVLGTITETYSPTGTTPATAGGAGAGANDGNTLSANNSAAGSSAYKGEKTEHQEIEPGHTFSKTEKALGSIKKMSIAVLVNKEKVTDTAPVQSFLKEYIKVNSAFTASVTPITFDKTAEEEAKKTAGANSSREMMQQATSILPVLALLVVAFLVMKAIAKAAKSQSVFVHAMPDGSLVASAPSLETRHHEQDHRGSVEDVVHALAHHRGEDVGEIETRMNKPLEQLKRMAQDRPESVAMLIKSWLLEERR